jgi:hypothetical protein
MASDEYYVTLTPKDENGLPVADEFTPRGAKPREEVQLRSSAVEAAEAAK